MTISRRRRGARRADELREGKTGHAPYQTYQASRVPRPPGPGSLRLMPMFVRARGPTTRFSRFAHTASDRAIVQSPVFRRRDGMRPDARHGRCLWLGRCVHVLDAVEGPGLERRCEYCSRGSGQGGGDLIGMVPLQVESTSWSDFS